MEVISANRTANLPLAPKLLRAPNTPKSWWIETHLKSEWTVSHLKLQYVKKVPFNKLYKAQKKIEVAVFFSRHKRGWLASFSKVSHKRDWGEKIKHGGAIGGACKWMNRNFRSLCRKFFSKYEHQLGRLLLNRLREALTLKKMDVEQEKAPVGVRQRLARWKPFLANCVVVDIYTIVIYLYCFTTSLPNEMEIFVKFNTGIAEQ